jgi:hypothetical protein
MSTDTKAKEKYVYVKDDQNNLYVCKLSDLKKPDELTDDEKDLCMKPAGDA